MIGRQGLITSVIVTAAALVPLGIVLGFYYDNPVWFAVAAVAFIFFMAG